MKRMLALCALLAVLTGCTYAAVAGRQEAESYDLYFREKDLTAAAGGDALRPETRRLEGAESWNDAFLARQLMTELMEGPEDESLKSTIPAGTSLLSVELEGSQARVDLSNAYRMLSGVSLTLADYAITLTLTQLPAVNSVSVTVRGE